MTEPLISGPISPQLLPVAKLAKRMPKAALRSLNHFLTLELLREAFERTRKDGATGVDGQTAADYERNLEQNLRSLLDRAKSGTYRAPPVRRTYIPKGDGKTMRPLGIPTFEDKVLQRAIAMILEAIYEQDFLPCSYGFRPARSAHDATHALREGLREMDGAWVLEVDIKKFFDTLAHPQLMDIVRLRMSDGVILRLIAKWLHAGVLEEGQLSYPEAGTPQGGVISPILANIYLHEVLDKWFVNTVKGALHGRAFLVRYADDFVIAFECEADARRVWDVLPKRFAKYGLTVHPDKTRLVRFPRPPRGQRKAQLDPKSAPGSFTFLGFTFCWALSRRGYWVIQRHTAKDRLRRAIRRVFEWCRDHRHAPLHEQSKTLGRKLRGHCGYYGVTGNSKALERFRTAMVRCWLFWLRRRSQRAHRSWAWFQRLLKTHPLPAAVAIHSTLRNSARP